MERASYGWHPDQLSASEFVALHSVQVSSNLDFIAEARRRPRPGALRPHAATDQEQDVGLQPDTADVADIDEPGGSR